MASKAKAAAAAAILPHDALFLGFDSSTQSLKATVVDAKLRIVTSEIVHFDSELPHYKTKDGVHRDLSENGRVTAPALMWVEALECVLDKLKKRSFPFEAIKAVSGSGQQHGSVYWKKDTLNSKLQKLSHLESLHGQLQDAFSTIHSPIWMDSSTFVQCKEIEEALGGAVALSLLTGSRAHERYTGPQIRKLYQTQKEVYENTERISLVSSFMASLLVGDYVSIDYSDAAGMNLMDFKNRIWSHVALEVATAPHLEEKLGPLAPPHAVAGVINPFFVERYDFSADCLVIQWSGDNLCSLAGLALDHPGDVAVSLGTSDTVFGITTNPLPGLEGHIFPNCVDPHSYMVMLVYKNGSLTREEVRDRCADGSWDHFNKLLDETSPLNDGKVGFFYKYPEILPPLPVGVHRFCVKEAESLDDVAEAQEVLAFDPSTEVRSLVEGQFLSMKTHSQRIGMPMPPKRIIATGGASANHRLLVLMATIFGCDVYTAQRTDSASLGAAFRAAHGWLCNDQKDFVPIASMFANAAEDGAIQFKLSAHAGPNDLQAKFAALAKKRAELEHMLVAKYGANSTL
ncbi:hypothetical protein O6H91_07G085200 [Diphasiastrum complanatum]|uniref:Uncharacterized protein n=1 Tax=Diphasiastrum complanatum TaxID=34168 RepID=A0ACC2D794_DIPCM|nr:hypothetical protein O6H91_07G085200 [Diphasiastrum complanatum]